MSACVPGHLVSGIKLGSCPCDGSGLSCLGPSVRCSEERCAQQIHGRSCQDRRGLCRLNQGVSPVGEMSQHPAQSSFTLKTHLLVGTAVPRDGGGPALCTLTTAGTWKGLARRGGSRLGTDPVAFKTAGRLGCALQRGENWRWRWGALGTLRPCGGMSPMLRPLRTELLPGGQETP